MINFLLTPFYFIHFRLFDFGDWIEDYVGGFTAVIQSLLLCSIPVSVVITSGAFKNMIGVLFGVFLFAPFIYTIHQIVDNDWFEDRVKLNAKIVWRKLFKRNYCVIKVDRYGDCHIVKDTKWKRDYYGYDRLQKWNNK